MSDEAAFAELVSIVKELTRQVTRMGEVVGQIEQRLQVVEQRSQMAFDGVYSQGSGR